MTLASNMWGNNTPYISSISWSRTTRSPLTGTIFFCRNRPCMGLQWQARQSNLPHLHQWVHTKVLLKYGHPCPSKAQLSPHKNHEVIYGAKEQLTHEYDRSPPLDNQGTKCIKVIVGALLYYDRAVDNKWIVGLSSIGSKQAASTERTKEAMNQILYYCATYPANGSLYRSINITPMVLFYNLKWGKCQFWIRIEWTTLLSYNAYGVTILMIILNQHGPLPTFAVACLFVSPGHIIYFIFAVTEELFGAIYCKMAVVSLYQPVWRCQRW